MQSSLLVAEVVIKEEEALYSATHILPFKHRGKFVQVSKHTWGYKGMACRENLVVSYLFEGANPALNWRS